MKPIPSLLHRRAIVWLACCLLSTTRAAETLVLCSPHGTHTASIGEHGRVLYRPGNDDAIEHTFYICNVQALAFSNDGELLAAAGGRNGSQGKIKVWRLTDHKQLCEIVMTGDCMRTVTLATDGDIVVAVNSDGGVAAWRVSDEKLQWSRNISPMVEAIQFAPDNKGLLLQCADGTEHRLDAAKGRNFFQRK